MPFLPGVRGVAWGNFYPYGFCCVFVNHFNPRFEGEAHLSGRVRILKWLSALEFEFDFWIEISKI